MMIVSLFYIEFAAKLCFISLKATYLRIGLANLDC